MVVSTVFLIFTPILGEMESNLMSIFFNWVGTTSFIPSEKLGGISSCSFSLRLELKFFFLAMMPASRCTQHLLAFNLVWWLDETCQTNRNSLTSSRFFGGHSRTDLFGPQMGAT